MVIELFIYKKEVFSMKAQNVGIVLAGTANLASSVLSPMSINVVHAETRDQIDQMNRDAQSVVERFHKNGGGYCFSSKSI